MLLQEPARQAAILRLSAHGLGDLPGVRSRFVR